jgi:3'(2'), 5'-bisphosphate nucleotidase
MSSLQPTERSELARALRHLSIQAGRVILDIYGSDFSVREKADASPVSDADERAEQVILEGLERLVPDLPVVAEEQAAAGFVPDVGQGRFFLVDPLDGTKEFISRNGEFTVNIALIEDGTPIVGVVHLPVFGTIYSTEGNGTAVRGSADEPFAPIACRTPDRAAMTAIASRRHRDGATDAYLGQLPIGEIISAGSSLKFCRIAEGAADIYPRFGRTMEWDTAAGHAVLDHAGGHVTTVRGEPLRYGKPGFENPYFVARGPFAFPPVAEG